MEEKENENCKYHIKTPTITFLTFVFNAPFLTNFNGVVLHAICILRIFSIPVYFIQNFEEEKKKIPQPFSQESVQQTINLSRIRVQRKKSETSGVQRHKNCLPHNFVINSSRFAWRKIAQRLINTFSFLTASHRY